MRVHQLGHGLITGDAISHDVLEIHRRLRGWGLDARLFAGHISPEYRDLVQTDDHFRRFLDARDDLLLYHYSIFDPNVRLFQAFQGRKVVIYHNITPAHFFAGWDPELAAMCEKGRSALAELRDCDLAVGDSDFNRRELVDLGFDAERTAVLPLFLSQRTFEDVPDDTAMVRPLRAHGGATLLFVGRIVPNKAVEDLIRIFYVYRRAIDPDAHLYLVGSRYVPAYDGQLDALVEALDLEDSVTFVGVVTLERLKPYYQAADLCLHASRHEGFCVPLIESMYFGVPILARKEAAVPETMGDAGVLYSQLHYEEIAEMAHLLITDEALRAQVIARQRERLRDFGPDRVGATLREILGRLQVLPPVEKPDRDPAGGHQEVRPR